MNCSDNNCSSCISDILSKIIILQKQDYECDNFIGCDKPFLGPSRQNICYNTRPIIIYNCSTANPWSFEYTLPDGTVASSNVLRIESLDECCATCRIIYPTGENQYSSTNQFVTIDLKCCGACRCLNDTFVDLC